MVRGIQQFAAHFSAFAGEYVIIGGMACTMLLERMNISFRATKDIDMVLTMNSENRAFVQALGVYREPWVSACESCHGEFPVLSF